MSHENQRSSVFRSVFFKDCYAPSTAHKNIQQSSKDSLDFLQRLDLQTRLHVHNGCVNTIRWNSTGEYILSGSDDQFIGVTNPHNQKILLKYKTIHRANIFSARFMPQSDLSIVSCSGDGIVLHTEFLAPYMKRKIDYGINSNNTPLYERTDKDAKLSSFNCHKNGTTYDVLTVPSEPRSFMSCGEDGTVRLFDLRQISSCHRTCCKDNILIYSPSAVNAIDLSPITNHYIAVGSSDAIVRIYDRRYLSKIEFNARRSAQDHYTRPIKAFPIPSSTNRHYRVTCVKYSPDESEMLVSYSSEYLYLFNLKCDGIDVNQLHEKGKKEDITQQMGIEQVTRRLRLRGDWSDTGPDARPENDGAGRVEIGQVRPQLHSNIMSRMTDVISRMLNDPRTRVGLTGQAQELNRENQDTLIASMANDPNVPPAPSEEWRLLSNNRPSIVRIRATRHRNDSVTVDPSPMNNTNNQQLQDEAAAINQELAELDMETQDIVFDYLRMKFVGHRNARTMIKEATFWGDKYVMSGSDCGHIFTWDRQTGKVVMLMQADQHVVNCLQPHPELPYLATSGIDYDVKIWAPILDTSNFDESATEELMKRNAIMLEQTKDTITVPAAFMIRMLACIHSLRNRQRSENNENSNGPNANNGNSPPDQA